LPGWRGRARLGHVKVGVSKLLIRLSELIIVDAVVDPKSAQAVAIMSHHSEKLYKMSN
jgi:hypothetical protein